MSELRDLYQEIVLDHYRQPRNFGTLDDAEQHAAGHNPLCGDRCEVFLKTGDATIDAISFDGAGCAISTASASLMTEAVAGRPIAEARTLTDRFLRMLRGDDDLGEHDLGKLEALAGVREIPMRVKCATLAWHTLRAALDADPRATGLRDASAPTPTVTTE